MRAVTDDFRAHRGNDVAMDWSHMTHWGWAMMAVWTMLWLILVAVIVVVGLRWAKLN